MDIRWNTEFLRSSKKSVVSAAFCGPRRGVTRDTFAALSFAACRTGHRIDDVRCGPGQTAPQTVLSAMPVPGSSEDEELIWLPGCSDDILTISIHRDYVSRG